MRAVHVRAAVESVQRAFNDRGAAAAAQPVIFGQPMARGTASFFGRQHPLFGRLGLL